MVDQVRDSIVSSSDCHTENNAHLSESIRNEKLTKGSTFQNMLTQKYANQASQIEEVDSRPSSGFDNYRQNVVDSGKSTGSPNSVPQSPPHKNNFHYKKVFRETKLI